MYKNIFSLRNKERSNPAAVVSVLEHRHVMQRHEYDVMCDHCDVIFAQNLFRFKILYSKTV